MEQKLIGVTGNDAIAYAVKQAKVDFVSAYPITPQTFIVETLSRYVANGEIDTKFVNVESEHSALSAVIGAALTGARTFTATSSQGLVLMYEELPVASGLRLPIVMALSTRALSAPINIHNDHGDFLVSRDLGWVMLYAEDAQEAYDMTLMGFKIAEDKSVLLPFMVGMDGFMISHAIQGVRVLEDQDVQNYLGIREARLRVDIDNPLTFGPLALTDSFFEFKRQQHEAMKNAYGVVKRTFEEYQKLSGRSYSPVKSYMTEDADVIIAAMGSTVGTARETARTLRKEGVKAGVMGFTLFRPLPEEEIYETVKGAKAVAVLEKFISYGAVAGPHYLDILSAIYRRADVPLYDFVYGLGGREMTKEIIAHAAKESLANAREGVRVGVRFPGVRE